MSRLHHGQVLGGIEAIGETGGGITESGEDGGGVETDKRRALIQ